MRETAPPPRSRENAIKWHGDPAHGILCTQVATTSACVVQATNRLAKRRITGSVQSFSKLRLAELRPKLWLNFLH
ncbi:hypothetical protein QFZ98_003373 [Paraburkholderia youngii]